MQARLLERQGTGSQRRYEAADERKRLQKLEPFFVVSKHRANCIFHKFTFSTWLQQILILGDNSQLLKPGIILADEPTASLDEANAGQVTLLLSGYARTLGSTLLVVSHDDAVLADMDRVLDLNRGIVREAA